MQSRSGSIAGVTDPIPRPAARIILIGPGGRVLLQHIVDPANGHAVWITPGGGLLPGESHEQAAYRELREEIGLTLNTLGPWVWKREHVFRWAGQAWHQVERFYLVRVGKIVIDSRGLDPAEVQAVRGHGGGPWTRSSARGRPSRPPAWLNC